MTQAEDLKSRMLRMLDEARTAINTGRLESLCLLGRYYNGEHLGLVIADPRADLCSLYGFTLVCMVRTIPAEKSHVEDPAQTELPISERFN